MLILFQFVISWILWAISGFVEQLLQDIQESLPCLDNVSGLLLYSLGTYLTDIIIAHLWEDYFVLIPRCFVYLWYTLLDFWLCSVWIALYWYYHWSVDPWGFVLLSEDVQGSFDSIKYQETVFFNWKKLQFKSLFSNFKTFNAFPP